MEGEILTILKETNPVYYKDLCYSVNRYKPLQNRLVQKPLQTVTNRYKPVTPPTVMNRYKPLQTNKNHLRPKLLHYQSDTTG